MLTAKDTAAVTPAALTGQDLDAAPIRTDRANRVDFDTVVRLDALKGRKRFRGTMSLLSLTTDVVSIVAGFFLAGLVYLGSIENDHALNMVAVCVPMFLLFSLNNNAHNTRKVLNLTSGVTSAAGALILAAGCLLLIAFFMKIGAEFSRGVFFLGVAFSLFGIIASRTLTRILFRKRLDEGVYAILCIYDGVPMGPGAGPGAIEARSMGLHPDLASAVAVNRLGTLAKGMDRVVIHCVPAAREAWALALKTLDVRCEIVVPELDSFAALSISERSGHTSLLLNSGRMAWNHQLMKRAFDLAISLAALPVLLPFFALVALAIKLDSRGPVFFRQERIGLGNRPFMIWKFRSMRTEACDANGSRSTSRDDDRITRVGRILRSTSIDELPQILNVISGDMSLVGPRPHAFGSRAENALFWDIDQRYWQRHVVKPGLTGLAQIRGFRGATEQKTDLTKRLQSDLEYVSNWSLMSDIRILLGTAFVVFHKNAF
ncbi:exopolysaccharide biosynthesis polyprenyl glycosylphosphotransferase [Blastomonas natatoria]|uniref:Exopolysaccharide biosynthesis polyprenyl glycosylphosphotransferase n=1 Tax=Blastomonas natatoria TaxID=34015 RepID=A0A2V3V472_9SPHN|nr:exopolysaccharide biosynthesis polyprenyl glycosylphosphotransferase [Blastomonas natatoria]PXW76280.1 exopolysaccharide biosynthesis polyprenyl glycosylphosphotransferase [Blastomonas natatoria]